MKKILKHDYMIITIVCALAVIIGIYILQEIAPFGKHSMLAIDFYHQYGPMLGELYDRVRSGSSLIYSFNMGMGLPFFRNFFNYLSSPFNILLFLFKRSDLLMSYSVIIGLKAVASAGTMAYFLKNKFEKNYVFIAVALLYGFSAYFTAYYWNIMWLDGMAMLPLITLGIEKLVNENKILLYVISLAVMLFANYFIGYMCCIFSVLYFIFYMVNKTNEFKIKLILKKILYFGLSSLIAGGLCAIFLIPLYYALKGISATSDVWPTSQYYNFTVKEFLFNHFTGVGSTVLKSGITCAPNISCGVLSIALLFIFWLNPKINLKTKISYTLLLGVIIASFFIAQLDFVWHAFHVPNDLPYRYSFIYSFILTIISAYSIYYIKDIKPLYVGSIYVIMLVLISLMKVFDFQNITSNMLILNYILITVYYLCYVIYIYFKKWFKLSIAFVIIASCLECIMVINNNWNVDQVLESFYYNYDEVKESLNYIQDSDFYRIEKADLMTFNDPSWYGYYGQVAFSSMEYENMAILQNNLGMPGNEINSFYYKQNTPIYNLMFNIKYIIGDNKDDNRYNLFYDNENYSIYKNNYTSGLMFGANSEVKTWSDYYSSPFENQNDFIFKATGISGVLEPIDDIRSEIVFTRDNQAIVKYRINNFNDNYYLYFDSYSIDFMSVDGTLYYKNDNYNYANECDDLDIINYIDYGEKYIINEKSDNKYIEFYVGYNDYYVDDFEIYKLNMEKFNKAYNYLLSRNLDITNFKESYIKAIANFKEDLTVYTSIPYDEGWHLYVDGKEYDTDLISNTLLSFDIPKGNHTIELKYKIPYLNIGLLISGVSLIGLITLVKIKKD